MTNRLAFCRAATLSATAVTITLLCPLLCGAAFAQDRLPASAAPAPKCTIPVDIARFELPLTRFSIRLAAGLPIKIVAIGSSSTFGTGASAPDKSYPSRLKVELEHHFPGQPITVLNRGVGGEETTDMLARFEAGVIAQHPHLVIWQVGTNALLRDRPLDPRAVVLHKGIARLRANRTDIVLMDPQYAPNVLAKANRAAMIAQIAQTAREESIGLLRRYDIMRHWHEVEHLPFETFVTADGLHMNDWGYACLAKLLGVAIAEAAIRPRETAAVPRR